jgi:hypothetical protein
MTKIVTIDNLKLYETQSLVKETLEELKGLKKDYKKWCKNEELNTYYGDNVGEFLKGITGDEYTYDNSYNYDNTIDNTIQYCFNKKDIANTKIFAIQFHQGGDVRGNYSDWCFYYGDVETFLCMMNDEQLNEKTA